MAIENMKPATPINGTIEDDEAEEISIEIENPDSVSVNTEDGGMIIDFAQILVNKKKVNLILI